MARLFSSITVLALLLTRPALSVGIDVTFGNERESALFFPATPNTKGLSNNAQNL
jgi:hypothetical protein